MTTVTSGEHLRRRYQWTVPTPWPRGAAIGDVQDALTAAVTVYEEVTSHPARSDDWLRVDSADEEIVFWFEIVETADIPIDLRTPRRRLAAIIAQLEAPTDHGIEPERLLAELRGILRRLEGKSDA